MFEDNKDFYPTPEDLIYKMLEGVDFWQIESILEPSAGKGDLADGVKKIFDERRYRTLAGDPKLDLDCIELQPELQMILKGKGYRVVHNNFLTYSTYKRYDMIISNPPFSQGAKHLLKMLEMQENGGGVICLLNAETLKNPYTAERKVLVQKLENLQADIQYLQGAFLDAERKTDVEVAIVKVFIPKKERASFIFEETLKKAKDMEYRERTVQEETTALADTDFIKAIVRQYNIEVEAGIRLIDEFNAMSPHILREFKEGGGYGGSILNLSIDGGFSDNTKMCSYNKFVRAVRSKYWKTLFTNPKFTGTLTSSLLKDYMSRVRELAEYDFSEYNIYTIREEMSRQVVKGIEDTIVALFDELSHKYHWYSETSNNIHYFNGWKTNKSWIINKKVIIPLSGYRDLDYSWGGYRPTHRDVVAKLTDIEKVFNYLDGGVTDSIDMLEVLRQAEEKEQTKKVQLKYFTVTFYKKGTCHIEFTNEDLLKKFNIFGSQRKNWLPPSYGKKKYKEMTEEEQAVVNEFEGEEAYTKVMGNAKYFIVKTDNLMMLASGEEL